MIAAEMGPCPDCEEMVCDCHNQQPLAGHCPGCGEQPCCCLQLQAEMQAYWNHLGAIEAEEKEDAARGIANNRQQSAEEAADREHTLWLDEVNNRSQQSWDHQAAEKDPQS